MAEMRYIQMAVEILGTIFCLIATICVYAIRNFDMKAARCLIAILVNEALLSINDSLAYYFRGNITEAGYIMVRVTNFFVYAFSYLTAFYVCMFINIILERQGVKPRKHTNNFVLATCVLSIFLLILSRIFNFYYAFDDHNNYYRLTDTYWISTALGFVPVIITFMRIIYNRKRFKPLHLVSFILFMILAVGAYVFQMFNYGISVYNIANIICVMFFFILYELEYANYMVEQERKIGLERELLLKEQLQLYHSQIQPHFIYNSLTTVISYLPPDSKAEEVLNHFTNFLRGSIDMLTETECIRAEREFSTVDNYLYMVRERFGEKIKMDMNVKDQDFFLPAFTVQTLVENAINHGIRKKETGRGTLTIKSYQTEAEHVIEVIDDGAGFDIDAYSEGGDGINGSLSTAGNGGGEDGKRQHIGLANLKKRLEIMCNGKLVIESTIGEGTTARVVIPKVLK